MLRGAQKDFQFHKYASQYLGALCYSFNRRFYLDQMGADLIGSGVTVKPLHERTIRSKAEVHDYSGATLILIWNRHHLFARAVSQYGDNLDRWCLLSGAHCRTLNSTLKYCG